ncbi:MAG: 2-oxoacid:acceptor oxidoreductase family protein [Acidobacteriota bacterium]|nr:2-oxoacid:acceptor oxidoreductase family protein [Acidobacteriota bacterium]
MKGTETLMAGFGGQGMLLAGKILAHAAMDSGLEVSWLPSYGPEMRGGTANVIVCISPSPVGSPLITNPRALLAMNQPSLDKFAPRVRPGGLIIINRTLIKTGTDRPDCDIIWVDSRKLAREAGNDRAANLVMLGAYVGYSRVVPAEAVEAAVEREFTGRKAKHIPTNIAAFRAGLGLGRAAVKAA